MSKTCVGQQIIEQLFSTRWIVRGTRAIFIDFSVYNGNTNLHAVVRLLFEFLPTGGVMPLAYISVVRLLRDEADFWTVVSNACEVAYFAFFVCT